MELLGMKLQNFSSVGYSPKYINYFVLSSGTKLPWIYLNNKKICIYYLNDSFIFSTEYGGYTIRPANILKNYAIFIQLLSEIVKL